MLLRSGWVQRHLSAQVGPGADHGDLRSPPTQALGLKLSAHDLARVPSIRPAAFGLANRPHGRRQRLRTGLSKPKLGAMECREEIERPDHIVGSRSG